MTNGKKQVANLEKANNGFHPFPFSFPHFLPERKRRITPQAAKANKNGRISVITAWYYGFKRRLNWANLISVLAWAYGRVYQFLRRGIEFLLYIQAFKFRL